MLNNFFFSQFQRPRFPFSRIFVFLLILVIFKYPSSDCSASSTPNITWTDIVGVTIVGNTITKNAATGWDNGGAASQEKFTGNGGISFTVAQAGRYSDTFIVGLSSSNLDADYASIEYAVVFLINKIHIFESGAYKGSFGLYLDGDSFSVERTGSTIDYKKNGTVFYTSATTTDAALLADVTIYNSGGTISDVRFNTNQSNQAPVLSQIGDIMVNEGVAISLNPTATDADGDTLTFSYSGWRTSRSYTTNYTDAGTHTVTVTVSDGILTDSQDVKITVLNTNQAPVLGQISDITVNVGDTVVFNPAAIDLDKDALAFSYTGWMESNSKTTNSSDSGTRTVTVTVSDGSLTDTQDVAVTVIGGTATSTPNITWTDIVGVTIVGNTITKNATTGWDNGGAASQEKFTGNGGISFTVDQADRYSDTFIVGLSSSNLDADYASIEYAVVFSINKIHIIESGAYKGSFGLYLDGDSLSVERTGSTINYKKNGTVFYTSATTTNAALLADVAIYNSGGTISNVRFNTNPVPMLSQISDTTLTNVSQVIVSWDANAEADLDGYNVWYRDLSKDDNLIKKYVKKPTTEITLNLTGGVTYYFEVTAEDSSGNKSSPVVLTYYVPLP